MTSMTSMAQWRDTKVLVTGAEGFIGSTLVEHLLDAGAQVRAFVHYKPYAERGYLAHLWDDIETVTGDVRDAHRVLDAVEGSEVVFHLAALIGIPYSYQSPEAYVQTNVVGTQNVAKACVRAGVRRMVHTSTSETYGTARQVPIGEDHPLQPQSPYSASKIGADMMALSYHNAFQLPVAVVRPFNTYGPRQSPRAVIASVLAQLHSGARRIKLGATTPTRDFTYVEDTVRGFLAVAGCGRAIGEVVNIGSGQEISIGDLVELLIKVTGLDAEIETESQRLRPADSEVHRLLADNSRIREWTGWTPQVSLEEGLRRTDEWMALNPPRSARRYQV